MIVPTGMLSLLVTVWLQGAVVGVISEGPFKATGSSCPERGEFIAKTLIQHRRPEFKGKIKIQWECSEKSSRIT